VQEHENFRRKPPKRNGSSDLRIGRLRANQIRIESKKDVRNYRFLISVLKHIKQYLRMITHRASESVYCTSAVNGTFESFDYDKQRAGRADSKIFESAHDFRIESNLEASQVPKWEGRIRKERRRGPAWIILSKAKGHLPISAPEFVRLPCYATALSLHHRFVSLFIKDCSSSAFCLTSSLHCMTSGLQLDCGLQLFQSATV